MDNQPATPTNNPMLIAFNELNSKLSALAESEKKSKEREEQYFKTLTTIQSQQMEQSEKINSLNNALKYTETSIRTASKEERQASTEYLTNYFKELPQKTKVIHGIEPTLKTMAYILGGLSLCLFLLFRFWTLQDTRKEVDRLKFEVEQLQYERDFYLSKYPNLRKEYIKSRGQ
jgi:ABC-type multidrug transport system fused ATPase/permease subunit